MPSTYQELKDEALSFINNMAAEQTIDTFIDLCEADLSRKLRHWRMERRSNAVCDTQYSALPTDFIEPVRLLLKATPPHALELSSQSEIMDRREKNLDTAGTPRYYAITDGTIEVFPTPDDQYTLEMVYISQIDALSSSNTSNWVLQYHPDAYLYGVLVHSAPFLGEDARMATWAGLFQNAIDAINNESDKAKTNTAGRRMKIRSY